MSQKELEPSWKHFPPPSVFHKVAHSSLKTISKLRGFGKAVEFMDSLNLTSRVTELPEFFLQHKKEAMRALMVCV